MKLRFLNQTVRMLAILLVLGTLLFNAKAVAMAKNIYFVDVNASQTNVKGQPFNNKVLKGDFFEISISYPVDHRVKLPLRQMAGIQVRSRTEGVIKFKILKWELKDNSGNIYQPIIDYTNGKNTLVSILGQEEEIIGSGLFKSISAYYDILPSVKYITINLDIELTSPEGKKVLVKESIPLKQATFTTSFFEGFGF